MTRRLLRPTQQGLRGDITHREDELERVLGVAQSDLRPPAETIGGGQRSATLVVAAYNSDDRSKEFADYVCDGVGDQITITAACDQLHTGIGASGFASGGTVLLLEGDYLVDATGTGGGIGDEDCVYVGPNVHLRGMGSGTRIARVSGGFGRLIRTSYIAGFSIQSSDNVAISDLELDGDFSDDGIANSGGSGLTVRRCRIHSCTRGLRLTGFSYVLLADNLIESCTAGGIEMQGNGVNGRVLRNTIRNIGSTAFHEAIYLRCTSGKAVGFTIMDNVVDFAGAGIFLEFADDTLVVNNLLRQIHTYGIEVSLDSDRNAIAGNLVRNFGTDYGIKLTQSNAQDNYVHGNDLLGTLGLQDLATGTITNPASGNRL